MADHHKYPGIDLPLRQTFESQYFTGAHPDESGHSPYSAMLQVRELAMIGLIDRLTDKPNWHEKVFNDEIVAKWRKEAMTQPEDGLFPGPASAARTKMISERAFDNCIAELRDKAKIFQKTALIYTLESGEMPSPANIIKADALVKPDLHQGLKDAFDKLLADQASNPDWHPWTSDMVQDIVHPSMYPFVYNRSRFIHQEAVGVSDAIDKWSGKGQVPVQNLNAAAPVPGPYGRLRDIDHISSDSWSEKYQWLPSTLAFQEDRSVRFTSYINNLHPKKYSGIYKVIEKLIDTAIPAWDHALSGHVVGSRFDPPPEYYEDTAEACWEPYNPELFAELEGDHEPDEDEINENMDNTHWQDLDGADEETKAQWREDAIRHVKWTAIRDPILPEPRDFQSLAPELGPTILDEFRDTGLQVYVKMASIELTPEKPDFPAGGWHVEGQMNEQIVATALYYVDSENVTPSHLSFRMPTSYEQIDLQERVGQDMHDYYGALYNVKLQDGDCLQHYGRVETQQGRLLVFPNTFQHQVSSFSLLDKTKPGHRRFIALWLVNPDCRVISTANVPPQQIDWWFEAVVGANSQHVRGEIPPDIMQLVLDKRAAGAAGLSAETLAKLTESPAHRLPPEILEMVLQEGALDGLMTADEAKDHRLALMKERSRFHVKGENNWKHYSFCEH